MPRDLGDVLDYFLPETAARAEPAPPAEPTPVPEACPPARRERPAALPIIALPIGPCDVVRAALAWNLAVEVARSGGRASLLAPAENGSSLLWPDPGPGPVGAEILFSPVADLAALTRRAFDVAVARAAEAGDGGGVVFVRVPPAWLGAGSEARGLFRWCLLFATPDGRDLMETYAVAKRVLAANPDARVGLTIHGVRRVADAERAFQRVAEVFGRRLDGSLRSYGLLVDDLHVYRAIVNHRPIGIEHPQSRAARALADVARLIRDDAAEVAGV